MELPEPQQEHRWLQKFVGDWTFEGECNMGPDQPPVKSGGKETVRSLGGLWILCDGEGEMPGGGTAHMIITLGYDPALKRFVGTFVGSMMTNLWVYNGSLDAAGKILTLDTEGPDFTGGTGLVKYQDIFEIVDDDHRILTSKVQGADGGWTQIVSTHYWRKK